MIGQNGHYALGPAVLRYAKAFRKGLTIRDRVLPYLEKLAILTKETVIFCESTARRLVLQLRPGTARTIPELSRARVLSDR